MGPISGSDQFLFRLQLVSDSQEPASLRFQTQVSDSRLSTQTDPETLISPFFGHYLERAPNPSSLPNSDCKIPWGSPGPRVPQLVLLSRHTLSLCRQEGSEISGELGFGAQCVSSFPSKVSLWRELWLPYSWRVTLVAKWASGGPGVFIEEGLSEERV